MLIVINQILQLDNINYYYNNVRVILLSYCNNFKLTLSKFESIL